MAWLFDSPKACFGFCTLLFDIMLTSFIVIKFQRGERSREFRSLVIVITLSTFFELIRVHIQGLPYSPLNLFFKNAIMSVCFIGTLSIAYTYSVYLVSFVQYKNNLLKIFKIINLIAFLADIIFLLVDIRFGLSCSYSETIKDYVRGPMYLPSAYFVPGYLLGFSIVVFWGDRKNLDSKVIKIMAIAIGIALATMIIQPFLHGKLALTVFGASLGLFLWYFAVENSDLQKLAKYTETLKKAEKAASDANLAKSHFLANMSHEIRTPMNAVLGLDEMILNSSDINEIHEYARNIRNSGQGLLSIINDILDFSKIESGKMELVETSYHLAKMIKDLEMQFTLRASQKGINFVSDVDGNIPDCLYGDELRLRQIVTNLLNNAIKYTKEGTVTFVMRGIKTDNKINLHVEVKDTGIGIKEEDLSNIWTSFQRFDTKRNHDIEGTGLGLTIVNHFVNLMGGTVKVQSEFGQGSIFTVDIPQKVEGETTLSQYKANDLEKNMGSITNRLSAPKAQVLIVDDNSVNLIVSTGFLKRTKAQITTCESGAVCLELMKKKRFDIIFLDHMMPNMDGVETLQKSRTMEGNLNLSTPVVALTANAIAGMREKYLELGFSNYVSKPIDSTLLYDVFYNTISKDLIVSANGNDGIQKTTENKPSTEKVKLIDKESGIALCGNDDSTYKLVLESFCQDRPDSQKKLEQFLTSEDWNNYEIIVHALKSGSKLIGSQEFSDFAKSLEFACKDIMAQTDVENKKAFVKQNHSKFIAMYDEVAKEASEIMEK